MNFYEQAYASLFDATSEAVFVAGLDGKIMRANANCARMLGFSDAAELVGRRLYEFTGPLEMVETQNRLQQLQAQGQTPPYTVALQRSDGAPVQVELRFTLLRDSAGRAKYIQCLVQDVLRQKQAEDALQESEVQNRLLFDESPDALAFLDRSSGQILRANRAYEQLVRMPVERLRGRTPLELGLIKPEEYHYFLSLIEQARSRHENYTTYEHFLIVGDGAQQLVESRAVDLKAGGVEYLLVSMRDISTRKQTEEALRRANLELERAVRMKDEFLSSMSHELHTPLTGILGLAEALRYTLPGSLNETQANAVMNIENSGRGLLDLINNLLDISRIEAGKLNVQMDPLALDEICQSSLNAVRSMAMKKKQTVQYSIEPVNLQVMGEARRLKQALVNLLSNAVKYSPENSQLGLQVSLDADSQIANLTVWDHGTGIAPQDMGRLFQPFVQLDGSLTRRTGGTGLGLALVQKLVDLHGGSVHVESTAGEGSRFTVSLPALRQAAASLSAPGTAGQATGAPSASAQAACRCLVSEENPTEAERLVHFLTVLGIEAGLQPAGADLVEQAARTQPDLVFVGIHLPDDGQAQQTLAALKANLATHAIPVVVTSLEDGQANVSLLGAAGGLQAHFSLPDLRHVLERVFSEKAESKPAAEEPAAGAGLAAGQRATVMYVDDNEINRVVMGEFLRSQGFVVITLESGYDFLLRAPQIQPDIVLMDIQMPGMDGLETMRRLRGHTDSRLASAPVIAITALETPGDRERCLAAGANEYLSKPIRMQELSALIRAMTE